MTDASHSFAIHRDAPASDPSCATALPSRIEGVVVGIFAGFDKRGWPLVTFPGNGQNSPLAALSSAQIDDGDLGCEVALVFVQGEPSRPMIIGKMHNPSLKAPSNTPRPSPQAEVIVDGERREIEAKRELVLKCGKASITLTRAGKVLIRGTYILSRSSGTHRIKGGSIQLN